MKKILLTGGEGFIGKHFKEAFRKCIDNKVYDLCYSYDLVNGDDIRDKFKLGLLFENYRFDTVINLAAKTGVKLSEYYPEEYFSTNVIGLQNIIDLCKRHGSRLIHFSSSSVFRPQTRAVSEEDVKEPISVYGISKLTGELLIKKADINWTIIRPFTVLSGLGRKGMIIDRWVSQIKNDEPITFYGDGSTTRGYTYVGDLIEGTLMSIPGDYNIGGNQAVSLNEMWKVFKSVFPKADKKVLPLPKYDNPQSVANTQKAFNLFGWYSKTDIINKIREWLLQETYR